MHEHVVHFGSLLVQTKAIMCLTHVSDPLKRARFTPGVRPFPCPHCDKIFRTSGHRKTHIASHFKNLQQKKHKFPRKSNKAKVSKSNLPLPDIPLQEPILITDFGKCTWQMYEVDQSWIQYVWFEQKGIVPACLWSFLYVHVCLRSQCSQAVCSHCT